LPEPFSEIAQVALRSL